MKKSGFTMLELVFVLVIMGLIINSFLSPTIELYGNYIKTQSISNLISDSEDTEEFLATKLKYINRASIIIRHNDGTFDSLQESDDIKLFEWIPYDIDGFIGTDKSYWSGIVDLSNSDKSHIELINSNLTDASEMIKSLGGDFDDGAIYFIGGNSDINGFGWDGNAITEDSNASMLPVMKDSDNLKSSNGDDFDDVQATELFAYAWSANGVELDDNNNLYFYYNYQPWNGEKYTDGTKVLLQKDVSTFKILKRESLLWIQICVKNKLVKDEYAICKEKIVF